MPTSPAATFLTVPPIPSTDTVPAATIGLASSADIVSAGSVKDETNLTIRSDHHSDPKRLPTDSLAAGGNNEPEDSPCFDFGIDFLEAPRFEQAQHEGSVNNVA